MLEGLKRLFSGGDAAPPQGWEDLAGWAQSRQLSFRAVHDTEGFIVEAKEGAQIQFNRWLIKRYRETFDRLSGGGAHLKAVKGAA